MSEANRRTAKREYKVTQTVERARPQWLRSLERPRAAQGFSGRESGVSSASGVRAGRSRRARSLGPNFESTWMQRQLQIHGAQRWLRRARGNPFSSRATDKGQSCPPRGAALRCPLCREARNAEHAFLCPSNRLACLRHARETHLAEPPASSVLFGFSARLGCSAQMYAELGLGWTVIGTPHARPLAWPGLPRISTWALGCPSARNQQPLKQSRRLQSFHNKKK